jgi:hypothetical protein
MFIVRKTTLVTLIVTAMLSAPLLAASPATAPKIPPFKLMEHQKMTMGNQVIYEADVNLADPSRKQYELEIGVDDKKWQYLTLDGSAGAMLDGTDDGHGNLLNGWMVSYVVTDVTTAGDARVELVFTIREPAKGIDKTEHVHATVKVGTRFATTTASGSKVWLIVTPQPV